MRIGLKTDLHKVNISLINDNNARVQSEQGESEINCISSPNWAISLAQPPKQ